jgi:radical SAM/Cys-rich protein
MTNIVRAENVGIAGPDIEKDAVEPFSRFLNGQGLKLLRDKTTVFQVNVGLLCNQACRHCHLEAGPARQELMSMEVAGAVIDYARSHRFSVIDLTGGAPEMNPLLPYLIENLFPLTTDMILRSNLTLLAGTQFDHLIELCEERRIAIICSFPSINKGQLESQRGKGIFADLIAGLMKLNLKGYGKPGTGLRLDLVSNPTGAFLPASQDLVGKKFRSDLEKNWGITFTNLYTFGNAPLGRFRQWLLQSGNYERYMRKLFSSFNPCTISGLMCRSLLSVSWDGYLYDCDFNQAANIPMMGERVHISQMKDLPSEGSPIGTGNHCYACTAGAGFT